ncbi:MAG: PKD-like family lipoprotein [Ginsengibacter sp.]
MKLKHLFYIISALLLGSCYKDIGNYDYLPFGDVQISFLPYMSYSATIGSEYSMSATVKSVSTGDTTRFYDSTLYDYEWNVNGTIISTKKDYHGICQLPTGQARGLYSVIDKKTKERSMANFVVNVSSAINIGWLVLSDKNGKSNLTYTKWQNPSNGPQVFTPYLNAYSLFNQGKDLGSDPVRMVEHYGLGTGESEILIIQNGGQGPVEISGKTLSRAINTEQEFIGGQFPVGMRPLDVAYYGSSDYLLGSDSNLYSRASPTESFPMVIKHNRLYNPIPVRVEGGARFTRLASGSYQTNVMLFYDDLNKRWLGTTNNSVYESGIYTIISPEVINPTDFPEGFTPTHNYGTTKILYSTLTDAYPSETRSILRTQSGQYRYQRFNANYAAWTYNITCNPLSETVLPISTDVTGNSLFQILDRRQFIIFSGGVQNDKVYYYNIETGVVGLYKDFNGTSITSLRMNKSAGNVRNRNEELGVGLSNGTFLVMDVSTMILTGGSAVELFRLEGLGVIKDVIYKAYNYGNSFNN